MSRNRQKNSNNVPLRIARKAVLVLLLIGIPAIIFISTFSIKKIEVIGANRYTKKQIKEIVFQTAPDYNSLYLYLKYRFFKKPKYPFVEKIEVEMTDNHSVAIYVYEKMIAGCVEFMGEYLYFDKDGIVVESSSKRLEGVPIIKGLNFNEIILSEKLKIGKTDSSEEGKSNSEAEEGKSDSEADKEKSSPENWKDTEQTDEIFDVIINLTQLIDKYNLDIDSVCFNSSNEVSLESAGITVLLGKRSTYDEPLSELKSILGKAKGMEITLDMRNYIKGTDSIIAKPSNRQNR